MHEGQAGSGVNRSCTDNVDTLNDFVQGRFKEDKETSLGLDKCEWLDDIEREDSSIALFMLCVEACISERECRRGTS